MKPAVIRVCSLLAVLLAVSASSLTGATARQATPVPDEGGYVDPAGRFTVPVPTNWTVEESDGVATLTDPDGDLTVHVLVVEGATASEGIVAAFQRVEPSFDPDASPLDEQTVPSAPGFDETVVITYDLGATSGQIEQGVGQRIGNQVYVLIFAGSLDAAVKRNSQVQIIASGFAITGVAQTDLSGTAALPFAGDLVVQFEAYVADLLARLEVPGAAIAVVQDGRVVYQEGFGVKRLGGDDPVRPGTRMMIGSTTKSMTTMMMATEVDDGLMTWDTPAQEILPEFAVADPELSRTITMRNLVCACTGVPRRDLELLFNANDLSAEEIIGQLAGFQFFTGFGEAFQYSNQMVATAGFISAAAAGGHYGDLFRAYVNQMDARVFDPIGMNATTFSFEEVRTSDDWATPHGVNLEAGYEPLPLAVEETLVPIAPAGAVWSTAEDMARYLQVQLSNGLAPDGGRVVSAANLDETRQPQVPVDAETSYGLGWFVQDYHGLTIIQHGGNTQGFTSDLAFLPDKGVGIVVLTNGQGANLFAEGVRYRLLELLFDQPHEFDDAIAYGLQQSGQVYAEMRRSVRPISFDEATELLGVYENPALGQLVVSTTGDTLFVDAGEFRSELRGYDNPAKPDARYLIATDPPLAGSAIEVRAAANGVPELVIDLTTDLYIFTRVEGTGLPPAASPVPD